MPCGDKCRDAAAAQPGNHAVGGPTRQHDAATVGRAHTLHPRQQFRLQKLRETAIGHVKLIAAIIAQHAPRGILNDTWLHHHTYRHGHIASDDEAVDDLHGTAQIAVKTHIETRRRRAVVLIGDHHLHHVLGTRVARRAAKRVAHHHMTGKSDNAGAQQQRKRYDSVFLHHKVLFHHYSAKIRNKSENVTEKNKN